MRHEASRVGSHTANAAVALAVSHRANSGAPVQQREPRRHELISMRRTLVAVMAAVATQIRRVNP